MKRPRPPGWVLAAVSLCVLSGLLGAWTPVRAQPQWTDLGLKNRIVRAIEVQGPYLFAGTDQGVYRRDLTAQSPHWTALGPDSLNVFSMIFLDPSTILAGGSTPASEVGIFRSSDQGGSWTAVPSPDFNVQVLDIEVNPLSPDTVYAANVRGVWRSVDAGSSWTVTTPGFIHRWNTATPSPATPGLLWSGGENGFFAPELYRSWDGAQTWELGPTPNPPGTSDNAVYRILIDPLNPDLMYFGMEGAIAKSVDGAATYGGFSIPLITPSIYIYFYDLEFDPRSTSRIFATGTRTSGSDTLSLFLSENQGESWTEFQHVPGFSDVEGWDLEPLVDNGDLVIFLAGSGVYRIDMLPPLVTAVPERRGNAPAGLHAPQVREASVRVTYSVSAEDTPVRLDVFDVQGRRVRTLEDTVRDPGEYSAVWRYRNDAGARIARGVYYVRLRTDTGSQAVAVVARFR